MKVLTDAEIEREAALILMDHEFARQQYADHLESIQKRVLALRDKCPHRQIATLTYRGQELKRCRVCQTIWEG